MFIPEDICKVDFVMVGPSGSEGIFQTSLAFEVAAPPDGAMREGVKGDLLASDWWNDLISTEVILGGIRFTTGTADPSAPIVSTTSGGAGGGAAGVMLPVNCSWLVQKQTARGGRKGRGRMYWPGVQADAIEDAGVVEAAVVTSGTTAIRALLADLVTTFGSPALLLHTLASDGAPNVITDVVLDGKIATQRGRLRD